MERKGVHQESPKCLSGLSLTLMEQQSATAAHSQCLPSGWVAAPEEGEALASPSGPG